MSFYDSDILIQNIRTLMENNGITQEGLADILGMSQPNVSKALSLKDKKSFTLDQVAGIAKHFGVSIDQLMGNRADAVPKTGPRGIAAFLAGIIESHDAKYTTVEIEEEVYEPREVYNVFNGPSYDTVHEMRKIKHLAIYFPDYWEVPKPVNSQDDDAIAAVSEAQQIGNESSMMPVNDFIRKFVQIYEIYEKRGIDKDAYRVVVDNYLSKLRE